MDAYRRGVITGTHVVIFSQDPDADRAFFTDVLEQPYVDAGGGWLIFKLPPAEVAMHPADSPAFGMYLMCDDLDATMADLRAKGAKLGGQITEERWGRVTAILLPGGAELGLYQPHHPSAVDL